MDDSTETISALQYKQLYQWLTDIDHSVRGNGRPGLVERVGKLEQTTESFKDAMKTRADRQMYLLLTILAALVVDVAQHWAAGHIK